MIEVESAGTSTKSRACGVWEGAGCIGPFVCGEELEHARIFEEYGEAEYCVTFV